MQCELQLQENLSEWIANATANNNRNNNNNNNNRIDSLLEVHLNDQNEIERSATLHRKEQQKSGVCFICYEDSIRPSITMMCCGQPAHINCINKW